jgi:IS30 family transposase
MSNQIERTVKSMRLTDAEAEKFKQWVDSQPTIIDAAKSLGTVRGTIGRVLAFKSGSPDTIGKVRAVIA